MHRLGNLCVIVFGIVFFTTCLTANAQNLCEDIQTTLDLQEPFAIDYFDGSNDIDEDGLGDHASLSLVEAVACLNPSSDLYDATLNAYEANLAIFDLEPAAAILVNYRELIATMMLIGAEMEVKIIAALDPLLSGDYVAVECTGADCVPDALPGVELSEAFEVFAIGTRAVNEPYTALGDLDNDAIDNLTEYNNVVAQNGFTSDFVIAATSSNLTGNEIIRTPGSNGGGGGGGCFIATAAYGTPMAEEINVLRDYRDNHLLTNTMGGTFVDTYYRLSPPVADFIAQYPTVRAGVRAVLTPILWLVEMPWVSLGLLLLFSISIGQLRSHRTRKLTA